MSARRRKEAGSLEAYNRKRRFDVTEEPQGELAATGAGNAFVVQKHDATRLHYDFRLEFEGVLKSWAVPKGPSLKPGDKRLAMQTEDHPVSYASFEGVIPEGEYGAGPVIVWDRGTWHPIEDPRRGFEKGTLTFTLHGEKLRGKFSLVRIKGAEKSGRPWLLIKRSDDVPAVGPPPDVTDRRPESVLSGRTLEDVAAGRPRRRAISRAPRKGPHRRRRGAGARLARPPEIEPQLATLVEQPAPGADYVYEIKYDGYRAVTSLHRGIVRIASRNGLDWTDRLPGIVAALRSLTVDNAVLDGEVCYVLDDGRTDFQHLQNAMRAPAHGAEQARVVYHVFDLMFLDGEDWRPRPLHERKARLAELLGARQDALRYGEHLDGDWRTALAQACRLGLEGLIGKRRERPYVSGRGTDWIKLKCHKRQEFVIVGMTEPAGSRQGFGALLLALQEKDGLRFAGKVGTGFTDRSLRELSARLQTLVTDTPPVVNAPRLRHVRWVEPRLVCEVSFTEFTRDGILRHPSFEGLREDKPPRQVRREIPVPQPPARRAPRDEVQVGGVRITHPERVMDRASGVTKGDLARYHEAVSPLLMPYAEQRPLALVRCPQGTAEECFFQKQARPGFSDAIVRKRISGNETLHVRDAAGLFELVQFNVVEFHGWGARLPLWDRPDWIVFDLDPDTELPFRRVIEAAFEMRELLATLNLQSFVKTTGGKGLHVVVPLEPHLAWDAIKAFTQGIARELARRKPDAYVATVSKKARHGRIFVDYLRNAEGATAILPYSPRTRPGATVAMPIDWKDLRHLEPREFNVAAALRWLRRRRRDPWATFFATRQNISERLGVGAAD